MAESDFRMGPTGDRAVEIRRSFEAEAEDVIAALLDPEALKKWVGAPEMPLAVCEVDAKAGGRYRIAWTRPDGSQCWMAGAFLDIGPGHVVATEVHRPDWTGGEMRVTTQVKDHEDRAYLRRIVAFASPGARALAIGAMAPGVRASLDRLEKVLTEEDED